MESIYDLDLKILVVDDMETYRKAIGAFLSTMGFNNVQTADNGERAFEKVLNAASINEPFELILSDLRMPVMDGLQLLKSVRAHPQASIGKVPFIVTSVVSEQDGILEAIKFGVNDYMIKPVDQESLEAKIATFFALRQTREAS